MQIIIDDEFVQEIAESNLDDKLTEKGLANVEQSIYENLYEFVYEQIMDVAEFDELMERNRDAEKSFPHYIAYHRNKNAFQYEFYKAGVFASEADARKFIGHDFITEFDEWKIVLVEDGKQTQIYGLNLT